MHKFMVWSNEFRCVYPAGKTRGIIKLGSSSRNFQSSAKTSKKASWGAVKRLSIDEISMRKGHQDFVTVVSDIDQSQLIEVSDSHEQQGIMEVLIQQPIEVREQVLEVSVDMWGGFPKVIQEVWTNAIVVYDRFHVMKYVNEELNKIRIQCNIKGKGSRFIVLKNGVDLKEEEGVKLATVLSQSKRLKLAYELKEEFREIFESHHSVSEGKESLLEWIKKAQPIYSDTLTRVNAS